MKRSVLLIVDGEAFRTPGFVKDMEDQGWDLVWADSANPDGGSDLPDLGLFDPGSLGSQGLRILQALRARRAELPLVALGAPGAALGRFPANALESLGLHYLDPGAAPATWPWLLRGWLDGAPRSEAKLTTEDLFGDILTDLAGAGSEARRQVPPAPVVAAPSAIVTVPVEIKAEAEDEPILEQFGNYNLLEKVAVGGMAELFKARQRGVHDFQKIVAIKRILPHLSDNDEFVRMFIDEAKLAAQLNHPNIVQIYDLGKASGFYYIAMEFVDGRDLRNLLRKMREYKLPMPEPLAATVIMKVASALDYAHRKRAIDDKELKLVHRDISPQNILISYEGAVKLVDFGIAKAATKSSQTQTGALKGKLLYMSPEQAMGLPLDGRSDLYSLGLVLAELLTGERCFQADSELGVLEKVRLGRVQDFRASNPAISAEMGAILDRVLQKDVERRYASARLLERDLKALLVKRNDEPTEHDVAEYVNTLLKGTREESETLLSQRFAPQAEPAPDPAGERPPESPAPVVPVPDGRFDTLGDDQPTLPGVLRHGPAIATAPDPAASAPGRSHRRVWLLAILGGLVLLAAWAARGFLS